MNQAKLKVIASFAAAAGIISVQGAALANTYDALCSGDINCSISVSPQGVSGPSGFIPSGGVVQWYQGGEGETNNTGASVAGGVAGAAGGAVVGALATCWTIILCPVGFFGGLAAGGVGGAGAGKRSDHMFTVIGYNNEGKKIAHSFRFINKKPARRMAMELPVMTGLAMGQVRPLATVSAALGIEVKDASTTNITAASMPAKIGKAAQPKASSRSCWSEFLERPGMSTWAEANPKAAQKVKAKKYDDC